MIKKTTIDQVYESARVEEVIGDFISLKKSGTNYKGLSPFTKEKTPSFMVSPVKQIWKDFSSGKGGNVVAFLMEHEHFSYPEAIKYLAKKYSIEIEESKQSEENKKLNNQRESMYLISDYACDFFQNCLINSTEGKALALSYFKERGFTDNSIKFFRLGYSPDILDSLSKNALKNGYNIDFLISTGLVIAKDGSSRAIDRFRGRIIFPIRSMSGRVQGFGGRTLSNQKKTAKYINSPESEVYNKSKILYGLFESKKSIAKEDACYIVEGYTDVIQLHQSGITNVVSSSGTALTSDQIRLIKRLTSNIILLFDSDPAGIRAALRGVDLILEQGINVRICTFPSGEDPDSFARNNSEHVIKKFLEDNTKDFIQFKARLLSDNSKNDPIKKTQIVNEIIKSISKISDVIKQEYYLKSCSDIMGISEQAVFTSFAQHNNKSKINSSRRASLVKVPKKDLDLNKIDSKYILEKQIISILLQYGHLEAEYEEIVIKPDEKGEVIESFENIKSKVFEKIFLDLQQDEVELADPTFRNLFNKLISAYQLKSDSAVNSLMFSDNHNLSSVVADIIMETEKYFLHSWDSKNIFVKDKTHDLGQLVCETILTLRKSLINDKINILKSELKKNNNKNLLEDIINYNQLKKTVSKKLNRVL
ncbi:MAG: DNA primase [Flavobacteriaceae bacterium]|mgnify:CR=1 FL=1|nr:DNA primase [Flavobacteriaceae bacterium]